MDISLLASALTELLAAALPRLRHLGESLAGATFEKMEQAVLDRARAIWDKLLPRIEERPAAQEAADGLAKAPADPDAQEMLRLQIKKLLAEDASLAEELWRFLGMSAPPASNTDIRQTAGDDAVQIGQVGGDVRIDR